MANLVPVNLALFLNCKIFYCIFSAALTCQVVKDFGALEWPAQWKLIRLFVQPNELDTSRVSVARRPLKIMARSQGADDDVDEARTVLAATFGRRLKFARKARRAAQEAPSECIEQPARMLCERQRAPLNNAN